MDFVSAKNKLREKYLELNFELVDEHESELYFHWPRRDLQIRISAQEINDFTISESIRADVRVAPVECSICSLNYREQVVDFYEYGTRRFFPFGDRPFVFKEKGKSLYVEVGLASNLFTNFFRFDEVFLSLSLERLRRPLYRGRDRTIEVNDLLYRPITIRVQNIGASSIENAIKRSSQIIESCLFEISYLKGPTLMLVDEWPRRQPRNRPFQFGETIRGNILPLPRADFNVDTIRFYQRGMSTNDPVIQFLSFYHVLEYYFLPVSDEVLYAKLTQRINDPKFAPTRQNLDRIIQDTLTHKRESDETEMLKRVLQKYVDEEEIISFLKSYEEYLGEKFYSRRKNIFGESIEVKLEPGHVISNIAKRIKVTRNALVHSADRYERKQRYIPRSASEKMLKKEIPLLKFLAEKVVIGSAIR